MEKIKEKINKNNWMVIPRRGRLDPDKWEKIEDGRNSIDYMFIDYPYARIGDKTCGLHGAEDRQRYNDRKDIMIDDVMTGQGSCYFMRKSCWDNIIIRLEDENYGNFTQEAQELSNKIWLSGGRVVVNKNVEYLHLHKGAKFGKGYGFSNEQYRQHGIECEKGRLYCIDFWVNNKWEKRVHDFKWLIEKFWPLKGWPENWEEQIKIDAQLEEELKNNKQ